VNLYATGGIEDAASAGDRQAVKSIQAQKVSWANYEPAPSRSGSLMGDGASCKNNLTPLSFRSQVIGEESACLKRNSNSS
jgi:hypothetical protein